MTGTVESTVHYTGTITVVTQRRQTQDPLSTGVLGFGALGHMEIGKVL